MICYSSNNNFWSYNRNSTFEFIYICTFLQFIIFSRIKKFSRNFSKYVWNTFYFCNSFFFLAILLFLRKNLFDSVKSLLMLVNPVYEYPEFITPIICLLNNLIHITFQRRRNSQKKRKCSIIHKRRGLSSKVGEIIICCFMLKGKKVQALQNIHIENDNNQ